MTANHRCITNIHGTHYIPVFLESTFTLIRPVFRFVPLGTVRAGLGSIGWVHVLHLDAFQTGLVFDVLGEAVEGPGMQILFVFTACSCRLSDIRQLLHTNDRNLLFFGEIDNLSTDFMVLVSHPSLLFVLRLPKGV